MTKPPPTVSVCMITYNHEKFIAQAIESVLMQQADFDYELVIGEDCSTDGTRAIVADYQKRYPSKIRVLPREKNLGMHENGMHTLAACHGQYIALLEGDDYWIDPCKLQKQINALEGDASLSACGSGAWREWNDTRTPYHTNEFNGRRVGIQDLLNGNYLATGSVCLRAIHFTQYFKRKVKNNTDWCLFMFFATKGDILVLPERMTVYRVHSGGVWSSSGELMRNLALASSLTEFLAILPPKWHDQVRGLRREYYLNIVTYLVLAKRSWAARCYWVMGEWPPRLSFNAVLKFSFRAFLTLLHPRVLLAWDKLRWRSQRSDR